jgi:exodeoxyribonuclease V alpha subunit
MNPANVQDRQDERLAGSVERVTFHSEESGFSVLRAKVRGHRELVTVVGTAATPSPGEFVECLGSWNNDKVHGLQFKARQITVVPPTTLDGIEKYLSSGLVRGVGAYYAKKLVKAFGETVFDVIEQQPERLLEIAGIGEKRLAVIASSWTEQKAVRDIMLFLQSHGVGTARAYRIYKTYRDQAIAKVTENPYRLSLDIEGIGFLTADIIAGRLGIQKNSLIRAEAGVRHVLQELSGAGHCAVPREQLIAESTALLGIDGPVLEEAIATEIDQKNIVSEQIGEEQCIYLAPLHRAEVDVCAGIRRIMEGDPPWGEISPDDTIPRVEQLTGMLLSPSQRKAFRLVLENKAAVITGGPGVGKTTLVRSILAVSSLKNMKVTLCAPTGRAAKRLSEATGHEAKTIHRLLEFDPQSFTFKRGRGNPLDTSLLVVDETSMVDVLLMNKLLSAVPDKAGLLLVGDVDQLPSVGPGAVLADIIASETLPTVRLTEIFRQAAASLIIVNSHRINQGEMPLNTERGEPADFYFVQASTAEEIHDKLLLMVTERIPKRFGLHPVRDIQVLTPMNRGGLGSRSLNVELQQALNSASEPKINRFGTTFSPGDKVIQTVNNYDKEVFNGDIGLITSINPDEGLLLIDFDKHRTEYAFGELDEVALAYATSIHKSQGSEYPAVVIPLAMQHFALLERNLVYTAVTRGKKLVVIIGQPKALAMAISNKKATQRLTNLAARLRESLQQEGQSS